MLHGRKMIQQILNYKNKISKNSLQIFNPNKIFQSLRT